MVRKPYVKRCHECRRRKVKCGGEEPSCVRCIADQRDCPGYIRALDIVLVGAPKYRPSRAQDNLKTKRTVSASSKPVHSSAERFSSTSSSQGLPPNKHLPSSPRLIPQYVEEGFEEDISHKAILSNSLLFGQPSMKEIETVATLCFLRSNWVPANKLAQSFEQPSFTGSTYVDRWPLSALSEADGPDGKMVRDGLNAAGIVMMAGSSANLNAMIKGQIAYHNTLQALRKMSSKLLRRQNSRERDLCLLACNTCSLYGILMHMPFDLISQHIFGIEVLLKHCGIDRLETQISRDVFLDMRCLNMSMSLLSFRTLWPYTEPVCIPIWWDTYPPAHSIFQQLLGAASGLPSLLGRFTALQESHPSHHPDTAHQMLLEAKVLSHLLRQWHARFRPSPSLPKPEVTVPSAWFIPHRPFSEQPFPLAYIYSSFEGAVTLTFFSAITIALLELMISLHTYLDFPSATIIALYRQSLKMCEVICQSLEFFFMPSQRLVGRITVTFPFPMASRAINNAMNAVEKGLGQQEEGVKGLDRKRIEDLLEWCDMAQHKVNDIFPNWSNNSWKDWN